jgi:hypothetical protein
MMWYWGGGMHWWGWLLGLLGMLASWAAVIWAVWYFLTGQTGPAKTSGPQRTPAGSWMSAWPAARSRRRSTGICAT